MIGETLILVDARLPIRSVLLRTNLHVVEHVDRIIVLFCLVLSCLVLSCQVRAQMVNDPVSVYKKFLYVMLCYDGVIGTVRLVLDPV